LPPDRPLPLAEVEVAVPKEEAEGVGDGVCVAVIREIEAKIVGRTTSTHLLSALEL
jgi:hypothetical protein